MQTDHQLAGRVQLRTCLEHVGVDSHPGLAPLDAGQNEGLLILRLQHFQMPNAPLFLACMTSYKSGELKGEPMAHWQMC